jgi:hypothetical protein
MIVEKLPPCPALKPLETGQLWRVGEGTLKVTLVGKLLVHYKLGKPAAVRVPNSISSITEVERFLKKNKAKLIGAWR